MMNGRLGRASGARRPEGVNVMRRVLLTIALVTLPAIAPAPATAGAPSGEEVRTFPGPGLVVAGGGATLVRQPTGASFTFTGVGLTPGNAHTIWFVAFNDPGACASPMMDGGTLISLCGLPDLANAAAEPTAVWGAGHVVGAGGVVTFGGRVAVGDASGCDALGRLPCGGGLTDPAGAEIHLVVRTHGPAIPELVNEQIHSFNRGCEAGEPNAGLCRNLQFAAFLP